ncbi:MAG: hypothetical protein IRY92_02025 [Dactylosporangium sp.]|nr:hypothetical protein [Dactylosporangium sp.]
MVRDSDRQAASRAPHQRRRGWGWLLLAAAMAALAAGAFLGKGLPLAVGLVTAVIAVWLLDTDGGGPRP